MEDNKLIAEFMGWDVKSLTTIPPNLHLSNLEIDNGDVIELQYHTSWDWLMPVIEKIMDISFQDNGDVEDFYLLRDCIPEIDGTYKAVVEFIKEIEKH